MANLLEISGNDIALLDDANLRNLIGLLCEADYRAAGLSPKGIAWGGHQDAADGGLDVVVDTPSNPPSNSFIPRRKTGFQVKKPDISPSKIGPEMKPKGILRESIKSLIERKGAYVIVSSTGSTSSSALNNRRAAMRNAVESENNHQDLHLEFLDRGQVATWVRTHPSLILWVRNKIGRPLLGWLPYENWANAPGGIEEEYLFDDGLRLHDSTKQSAKGISAEEGLNRLRSALSSPGTSVRLAGLSGVGKTRLVQAIFDERVGKNALNPSQTIYADISDWPDPDPKRFAEQLIATKQRVVLIIDNCPPDLHRRLTDVCTQTRSTVSLITVEYDVRDDLPLETNVFRLEPASEDLISKLIEKRFTNISQVDARTIAKNAGGNARLAIVLANTVEQGETLSGFHDEELFERLFKQRKDSSEHLMSSAEVCSLVYSFEGKDVNSEASELTILSSLIKKSSDELYRDVAELKERDLVQSRGIWRAVLPQAIANKLARRALETIPKEKIVSAFFNSGSDRLVRSFSRRLNFLHDCLSATEIVDKWLSVDGWIGNVSNLNELGMDVLKNIAPVSPLKALEAIERAANGDTGEIFTSRENPKFYEFVRILRSLAYDRELFQRSANLICRYALIENKDENNNSSREILRSLFFIYLSGTQALAEERLEVIEALVGSDSEESQELGLLLLDSALETGHFTAVHGFEFGARPRDYGYTPKAKDEIISWYQLFLETCGRLARVNQPIANKIRKILAQNFRGLWARAGMYDILETTAQQLHNARPWNEGWIAVRQTIHFGRDSFNEDILYRLRKLEILLRPTDLVNRARIYALSDRHHSLGVIDDPDDEENSSSRWERAEEITRDIGAQVSQDPNALQALIPDLVSTQGSRLVSLGRGLSEGCADKGALWQKLWDQLNSTEEEKRNISVFVGFISSSAKSDPEFCETTLNDLGNDPLLGNWFLDFQTVAGIDQRGLERLHDVLDAGKVPILTFQRIAWGRAHEAISDDDLAGLLKKIITKDDGIAVAMEILSMRFYKSQNEDVNYSLVLISVGRDILSNFDFPGDRWRNENLDYNLSRIAEVCLEGEEATAVALSFGKHLIKAIAENRIYAFDCPDLLKSLSRIQPISFLDAFLGSENIEEYMQHRIFFDDFERKDNPLNHISDEVIISWCDEDPGKRYPKIAGAIQTFHQSSSSNELEWKPIVYSILEKAPDLEAVLNPLLDKFRPTSWSGARSEIMQKRTVLLEAFLQHGNSEVVAWARERVVLLREWIEQDREWEKRNNRAQNESFE